EEEEQPQELARDVAVQDPHRRAAPRFRVSARTGSIGTARSDWNRSSQPPPAAVAASRLMRARPHNARSRNSTLGAHIAHPGEARPSSPRLSPPISPM